MFQAQQTSVLPGETKEASYSKEVYNMVALNTSVKSWPSASIIEVSLSVCLFVCLNVSHIHLTGIDQPKLMQKKLQSQK